MKKKLFWILISISILIIIIIFFIVFNNKTFLKEYYEIKNEQGKEVKIPIPKFSYYDNKSKKFNIILDTFIKQNKIREVINNYLDTLESCYDESYFYDKVSDITIKKYYVKKDSIFNKIYLEYEDGNYCENEFVLENNWLEDFISKAEIGEIVIEKCLFVNENIKCQSKSLENYNIKDLLELINNIDTKRIENKNNISFETTKDYYLLSVYYSLDNSAYKLNLFNYNGYLAVKRIDSNDHQKNAIYDLDENINKIFEDIFIK